MSEFTTHKGLNFKARYFEANVDCHREPGGFRYSWQYTVIRGHRKFPRASTKMSELLTYELACVYGLHEILTSLSEDFYEMPTNFPDAWRDIRSTFIHTCRHHGIDTLFYFDAAWMRK